MASNPMIAQIMQALGQPQMPGQAPGGASGGGGDDAASQYAQQVADLKGADPNGLMRQVKQMKEILAIMGVQNLNRLPNVSGKIFKLIPQLDSVMKEIQMAANVEGAVRPPIAMGAASPPSPEGPGTSTGGF